MKVKCELIQKKEKKICYVICLSSTVLCGSLERWCAGRVFSSLHSDTGGRRVMLASLVFWRFGASGMGANAV